MSLGLTIQDSSLVAAAGEFYVLSRLCLLGMIAAQAPRGVRNADIVVTSPTGERLYSIQVKARRGIGSDNGWHMSKKHEDIFASRLFYAFVDFGNSLKVNPITYIVPSEIVARAIRETHIAWLEKPGMRGQKHNPNDLRRFMPDYERTCGEGARAYFEGWLDPYREAWNQLDS